MNEKKIEPTDAMVDEAANMLSLHATGTSLRYQADGDARPYRNTARTALRAALNHPDAPGLFADEDDRPWEPLNGGPLRVGDEVRHERSGITTTAVVAHVDEDGDLWTAEGAFIGPLDVGTWHVRRAAQELPTEDGAVIERADGHKYITAIFDGETYRAREAVLGRDGRWYGVWRRATPAPHVDTSVAPEHITPGTWQVDDR